ncbi:MAG: phosphomannomutase [Deltaproteobacteria bacterium]|nr:phosphomannomutase [Deltaproteobacteria bacterium]
MDGEKLNLSCFKAYDIRGRVPEELDEELAWRIGRVYAEWLKPRRVVVGRDVRLSGPALAQALSRGLREAGAEVFDIGLCGTEEVYFATFHFAMDGGIMVTASHNPAAYNGMKLVREESRPISGDSGLDTIRRMVREGSFVPQSLAGGIQELDHRAAYVERLLGYVDYARLKPLKIVANSGNGCAGPVLDRLAEKLPFDFIRLQHEPDGNFPNGVPNPLLPENRAQTAEAVRRHGADFGIAWDGDFDRCFLFDERGDFIEGYYLVGLLAGMFLRKNPGARIIHDPRLVWNTIDIVRGLGGTPIQSKTGHAFIKERMRREDAVYGGEMSAHHYFRDFAYCDSGMIPWLATAEWMSVTGQPLSQLVEERKRLYPVSGELNRKVADPAAVLQRVEASFPGGAIDRTDGLSVEFADWRFNLRSSNTEPILRLNVEARGNEALMWERTEQILRLVEKQPLP